METKGRQQTSLPTVRKQGGLHVAHEAMRQVQEEYLVSGDSTPSSQSTLQRARTSSTKSLTSKLPSAGQKGTNKKSNKPRKAQSTSTSIPLLDSVLTNDKSGTFAVDRDSIPDQIKVSASFIGDDLKTTYDITYNLPKESVKKDCSLPMAFPMDDLMAKQTAAVAVLDHPTDVEVSTSIVRNVQPYPIFNIVVKGKVKESVANANKAAWDAAKEAKRIFLDEYFYHERKKDSIAPDYDRLYRHYAPMVAPVAVALRQCHQACNHHPRQFADLALAFVQSIPYERADGGFRRPLSVLTEFRGNCGSKTTLFLALLHHAFPTLDKCVCYAPQHIFAGIKLEERNLSDTMVGEDNHYVGVEPVGPGRLKVGQLRSSNDGKGGND